MCVDLGLVEDMSVYDKTNWFWEPENVFAIKCSASRDLPTTPENFDAKILPKLKFTVEADREDISTFYATTYRKVIGGATELSWNDLGWAFEMQELMPVLLSTEHLARLTVRLAVKAVHVCGVARQPAGVGVGRVRREHLGGRGEEVVALHDP